MSMFYKKNLPKWERALRVVAGVGMTAAAFALGLDPWLKWAIAASGASLIAMGFVGFCPMCAMVGRKIAE